MKRPLTVVLGTALATAFLGAAPASAQQLTVSDPQGDSSARTLDILSVTFRNRDAVVVADMTFADTTRDGDIIVSVDPRGGTGVRMVSTFRAAGGTKNFVLHKAFTDRGSSTKRVRCPGFSMRQGTGDGGSPSITLRMPSRCLAGGNFGALRFAVLIEHHGDRDWAPAARNGGVGSTDWVARG